MKPIIVIVIPLGMCIDREITEPYGYDLFYGDKKKISKLSGRNLKNFEKRVALL